MFETLQNKRFAEWTHSSFRVKQSMDRVYGDWWKQPVLGYWRNPTVSWALTFQPSALSCVPGRCDLVLDAATLAASSSRGGCAAGSGIQFSLILMAQHCIVAMRLLQGIFLSLGFKPWEVAVDLVDLYLLLGCTFQVYLDLLWTHINKEQFLSVNSGFKISQVVALSLNFYL